MTPQALIAQKVRLVIEAAYYGSRGSGAFLRNSGAEVLPNAWLVLDELEAVLAAALGDAQQPDAATRPSPAATPPDSSTRPAP